MYWIFFKWKDIVKLCLVYGWDMYFSDCFATNDHGNYPSVSELKNSFDFLHVSGFIFHGNGFTPVWHVGTENTLLMPLKTVLLLYRDKLEKKLFQ